MQKFSEFKFISTYNIAAGVREKIISNEPEEYISDFFEPRYQEQQYLKPSKTTLLHDYIEQEFSLGIEYMTKHLAYEESIEELVFYLDNYRVPYLSYAEFLSEHNYYTDAEPDEFQYEYSLFLEKLVIQKISPFISDEVFSILFRDRKLLMEFNKLLAETVVKIKFVDFPKLLAKDGFVIRCSYWPEWVRRALMYRDQGSCAICLNDISGLLKVNFDKAIDHIVPLKLGGTNDITNLQILCEACNLKKLDHTIQTSEMYSRYF
ncbi:HNH endonuclease [Pedobacter chitinilyticus]|uniref:HNH endonuclease n=1 Tax=Pedobacter chitinilyticus TaxID=2233776 RepID=A0A443Z2A2_9SPHI|nr:HNH endonuclease signature motif containing protein [Pedobacter chitinilyticus]RWU10661.1 HNH endonuclease [Pedobacter chitinilyticus]